MGQVQLRLYVETENDTEGRAYEFLRDIENMFLDEGGAFKDDFEVDGDKVKVLQSRLEHGW